MLEINFICATNDLQKGTKKLVACDLQFFLIFFILMSFYVYGEVYTFVQIDVVFIWPYDVKDQSKGVEIDILGGKEGHL